jgi:uroporphyrin-III C-methyltransferase / precorrin-2 dehydrogenase / sirohydrochlorin ferrochelatase
MRSFPAFVPLEGRRVAVIGSGPAAEAKSRLFEDSPATLLRFADPPSAESLADVALVFIAEDDPGRRTDALAAAKAAGAWVNVVDHPSLSDFYTPAIVDRGELVIGVSTSGAAPTLARDLRARIEQIVPAAFGRLADFARSIRHHVLARRPSLDGRRRAYEAILRGAAGEAALVGDFETADRLAERVLAGDAGGVGVVHLVGAGPGDPDLLTLKALRVLQDADIVFHDKLVDRRVLDLIRRDAERVFVGKAKGDHSVSQRDIEALLIAEARKGRRVVRLKGGDPFVFGRGGEELEALRAAGIAAHVVPGITAAIGCAAEIGAPLTHRDLAHAVTFISGRGKEGSAPDLDWRALAAPKHTLVVYMGVDVAADIARNLIDAGRAPSTPIAVVENGATPDARHFKSTLDDLAALIAREAVAAPSIILIGEVAALADVRAIHALAERVS